MDLWTYVVGGAHLRSRCRPWDWSDSLCPRESGPRAPHRNRPPNPDRLCGWDFAMKAVPRPRPNKRRRTNTRRRPTAAAGPMRASRWSSYWSRSRRSRGPNTTTTPTETKTRACPSKPWWKEHEERERDAANHGRTERVGLASVVIRVAKKFWKRKGQERGWNWVRTSGRVINSVVTATVERPCSCSGFFFLLFVGLLWKNISFVLWEAIIWNLKGLFLGQYVDFKLTLGLVNVENPLVMGGW